MITATVARTSPAPPSPTPSHPGHQAQTPIQAAQLAVYETLKALREGTAPRDLPGMPRDNLMGRVTREADYKQWTKDFLGGD